MPGDSSLPGSNALLWAYSLHTFSLEVSETPRPTSPASIPVLGQICSQELCLFVLPTLGPPGPRTLAGPFMWVPEPWQGAQSSIYSQQWVQSFGLLNSIFVCPRRPRFIHSAVCSDSEGVGSIYMHAASLRNNLETETKIC